MKIGQALFERQGCTKCHTTSKAQTPRGPLLAEIATRYKRPDLVKSIVQPSATIAQGFATNFFVLRSGATHQGFVTREAEKEVEIRTADGTPVTIEKSLIVQRGTAAEVSIMPEKLVDDLTADELASLVAFLESLGK